MISLTINLVNHSILALIYASILIMMVIGLNMTYSVLKFSNFAHAEFLTLGMYIGWWSLQVLTFFIPEDTFINNIIFHACFAFIGVGLFGILCDVLVFERMRNIKANPTTFTVGSIGIALIARFIFGMIWGETPVPGARYSSIPVFPNFDIPIIKDIMALLAPENRLFSVEIIDLPVLGLQRINMTSFDLWIIIFAFLLVFSVDWFFKNTKLGIAMRATSDTHELAQVSGIDTKRIIYYTWFIAAGITGFAGAWIRAKQNSFRNVDGAEIYLLPIFACAILGGVGSFRGGIIAAFILAYVRQGTTVLFSIFQQSGSVEDILNIVTFASAYKDGIGFVILIIVLLYRPQGISGTVDSTRARV